MKNIKEFEKIRKKVNILFEHLIVETKKMSKREVTLVKKFVDMNYELGKEHQKTDVLALIGERIKHWKILIKRCKDIANKDYDEIEIPIYQGKIIAFLKIKAKIQGD